MLRWCGGECTIKYSFTTLSHYIPPIYTLYMPILYATVRKTKNPLRYRVFLVSQNVYCAVPLNTHLPPYPTISHLYHAYIMPISTLYPPILHATAHKTKSPLIYKLVLVSYNIYCATLYRRRMCGVSEGGGEGAHAGII